MNDRPTLQRALCLTAALSVLASCTNGIGGMDWSALDWDLRSRPGALNTSDAARGASAPRPAPDSRGIISYPTYQVAVGVVGDVSTLLVRVWPALALSGARILHGDILSSVMGSSESASRIRKHREMRLLRRARRILHEQPSIEL